MSDNAKHEQLAAAAREALKIRKALEMELSHELNGWRGMPDMNKDILDWVMENFSDIQTCHKFHKPSEPSDTSTLCNPSNLIMVYRDDAGNNYEYQADSLADTAGIQELEDAGYADVELVGYRIRPQ